MSCERHTLQLLLLYYYLMVAMCNMKRCLAVVVCMSDDEKHAIDDYRTVVAKRSRRCMQ